MNVEDGDPTITSRKIICTDIPLDLLDKNTAKQHFRQFGRVLRIIIRPKGRSCIIEYDCVENAQKAILNGGDYMGHVFAVNWLTHPVKRKIRKDPDPDWVPDPEIQAELSAMSATGQEHFKKEYNLRPEGMVVDTPDASPQVKKVLKRNWKSENVKRPKSPKAKAWTPEQLELLEILKQPALTTEEKFKVLEARDKLIRLRTAKQIDLKKTAHTVGTCPDMCPEKERLMRETQHQVAMYEQDSTGKGMNPFLAIKQYSRSSADQEVPLPHELRPVSVLQLTMGYLMHRIMNLCDTPDVNLGEWYHFLWDRSRSIRKDITQQELCCQGSVALLEQCARFHIHCSARLVGEDPSVFDHRINTENLTKCLQTLKYMYHDLNLKNVSCPNEAEFRAYVILLNLNDGNFMWEVQQLKPEIQISPEIKFALEVYSAIDKNNFVKFFKLVRSTGYLNACILLRYFVQVRTRALTTIVKCYSPRAPYTQFPLTELERLLAFEDADSTVDFLVSYGLYMNPEDTHIVLDRKSFQLLEVPYVLDRAISVVESKRTSSVGEVVNGGPLPPPLFESYVPCDSFHNQTGVLQVSGVLADILRDVEKVPKTVVKKEQVDKTKLPDKAPLVEETKALFQDPSKQFGSFVFKTKDNLLTVPKPTVDSFQPPTFERPVPPDMTSNIFTKQPTSNIFVAPKTSSIFGETPKASIFGRQTDPTPKEVPLIFGAKPPNFQEVNVAPKPMFVPNKIEEPKVEEAKSLFRFTSPEVSIKTPQVDREAVEKARLAEKEKQEIQEKEEKIKREILELKQKAEVRKKLVEEEKQRKEKERSELAKQKQVEEKRRKDLLEQKRKTQLEIKRSVKILMEDMLGKVEEKVKNDRLKAISANIKNHKMSLFLLKWKQKSEKYKRKRQAMDQNPIWLPSRTTQEEAEELFTDTQNLALQNIKRYKCGESITLALPSREKIPKMDVARIYKVLLTSSSKIYTRLQREMFWKVTVSLPDFREFKLGLHHVEEVLTDMFEWKDRYGSTVTVGQYVGGNRLSYAVEKKQGVHAVESTSNGLLFIANEPNDLLKQRIKESLKLFQKFAVIPVSVIFVNNNTIHTQDLNKILHTNEHVANYDIQVSKFTSVALVDAVTRGLNFLAQNLEKPPPLEMHLLKLFLDIHLATELWKRVASYGTWNSKYKNCLKSPNLVIRLYNEAVELLKTIVLDESCLEYPNFADEFDKLLMDPTPDTFPTDYKYFPLFWKTDSYRSLLLNTMNCLRLPNFCANWPPKNAPDLEQDIFSYCSKVFQQPEAPFYKIMAIILRNFDPMNNFARIKDVLWTNVIEVIALEKLKEVDFTLQNTEFHSKSIYQQMFVVYNSKTLSEYSNGEWFYLQHPLVKLEIKKHLNYKEESKKVDLNFTDDFDLEELEKSIRQEDEQIVRKRPAEIDDLLSSIADLEESIEIQKKICIRSQDHLKRALDISK